MKLIVYVLSALLIVSCVKADDDSDKNDLDYSDLSDSEVSNALKYGINWIFGKAAEKFDISPDNIDVTKVNKIQKWEDHGDNYYYFDVEAENDDAQVNSTYNVRCFSNGEMRVVNEWQYTIDKKDDNEEESSYDSENNEDNEDSGDYQDEGDLPDSETNVEIEIPDDDNKCKEGTEVPCSQLKDDSDLRDALGHGITWIFGKAHDKFDVSGSGITVKKVNAICTWEEDGNTYWHFEVEATNDDEDVVDSSFNVKRESDSGDLRVVNKWEYNVDFNDNKSDKSDSDKDEGDDHNTDTYQDNNEEEIQIEVEFDVDCEDENDDSTGKSIGNDGNRCKEGTEVDCEEVYKDENLKAALEHGVGWIFGKAHDKFDISESGITVKKVGAICTWEKDGNTYWHFEVEATNDDEDTVDSSFNVKQESDSGDLRVVNEWSYNIDYGEDKPEENDSYNNENDDQSTDVYQDNDEEEAQLEIEIDVDCEDKNEEDDSGKSVSSGKCKEGTEVDCEEVYKDEDLKAALEHGVAWIFENAHDKFDVSESGVTVKKVDAICTWEKDGNTYWHFEVEATNDDEDVVDSSFNVKQESDSGDLRVVNKWSYNIDYGDDKPEENDSYDDENDDQNTDVYQDDEEETQIEVEIDVNCEDKNNDENN